jgi:hypothetical protein
MRFTAFLATTLLIGCAGTAGGTRNEAAGRPEPSGNDEVMRDDVPAQHGTLLRVTLEANPEVHIGQQQDELSLHVRLTNEGEDPIDASALAAQLILDDVPQTELDLTGHGWTTLQPGESAEWDHDNLGVRLFDEPGEHTLRLEVGDALSEPTPIRVSD